MGFHPDTQTMNNKGKAVAVSSPNINDIDDDNVNIGVDDLDLDDDNNHRSSGVSSTSIRFSSRNTSSKYDFVKVKVWLGDNADHYYVLSRFLLSRMLTVTKIPNYVAIKIALELKKLLIDNSLLDVSQSDLEVNLFKLMERRGYGEEYINRYKMMTRFHHQRVPLVILVCGTACVGKSTIATQLAQRLNLPNVLQTDMVYELLRTSTDAPLTSTPVWERDFSSSEELITEFCRECRIVRKGLAGDLKKAMKDGKPIIIEGIHLDPSIYLMEDDNKTQAQEKTQEADPVAVDGTKTQMENSSPIISGSSSEVFNSAAHVSCEEGTPTNKVDKVSDHLEAIDLAGSVSEEKGESVTDPELSKSTSVKKEKSGTEPIIIPLVLKMAEFDHKALLEEVISTRTFSDKSIIQDKDKLIRNLKTIQDYLCSFNSQGLTVVNISSTTFPQTLDWLHGYLLEEMGPRTITASSKYDFVKVKVWLGDHAEHYYVFSRFLLSQMLTVTKIPNHAAIRIALELKKLLVDNSLLDVSQSDLEANMFKLMEQRGYGEEYANRYKMMTRFHHQRVPLIILLCGTACVGKSTIATQISQRLNLPNVMQTDVVYELLRTSTDAPLASTPVWARDFSSAEELITEFCRECRIVRKGLAGDLKKAVKDGKPIIIEGMHIDPNIYLMEDENKTPDESRTHLENVLVSSEEGTPTANNANNVDYLEAIGLAGSFIEISNEGESVKGSEEVKSTSVSKEKCGPGPIIIPLVLKMAEFDHNALLEEWFSTFAFNDKLVQDKDKLASNLKTIQDYLCSFNSKGLKVLNLSTNTFNPTLDWLHGYLLEGSESEKRFGNLRVLKQQTDLDVEDQVTGFGEIGLALKIC
ncbi:hypothetical protein ACFX1S_042040 [Malus domestica]